MPRLIYERQAYAYICSRNTDIVTHNKGILMKRAMILVNCTTLEISKWGLLLIEYKNLWWVWGLDRKICPEDRHLASRGLPSYDKRWFRGTDFSILPSHEYWILFLARHNFFYLKISFQKSLNTLRYNFTLCRHFNRTMTSFDDNVREFQYNQCM